MRGPAQVSRKELRAQKRHAKAEKKRLYYLAASKKRLPQPGAAAAAAGMGSAPRSQGTHSAATHAAGRAVAEQEESEDDESSIQDDLAGEAILQEEDEEEDPEDAEIARLERLLGSNVADASTHPDMAEFLMPKSTKPVGSRRGTHAESDDDLSNDDDDAEDEDHLGDNAETVYISKSANLYGASGAPKQTSSVLFDAPAGDFDVPVQRIKSALNRVTKETLAPTLKELLSVYATSPQSKVTAVIAAHVAESASAPLSPIFAALVACLDIRLKGAAVGATLLEELVRLFETGQGTFNHAVLVAHCCSMGIAHEQLLLDLAQALIAKDHGKALVAMLEEAGARMRRCSPAQYKSILQSYAGPCNVAAHINSKKTAYQVAEARLRPLVKFVRHERGEQGAAALRVSYDDLAHADEKGRWWIVGGKWQDSFQGATVLGSGTTTDGALAATLERAPPRLLAAAAAQGMNTDVRKAVFCVLMGSSDYIAALDGLLRLGLTEPQEREAVRVILQVCSVAGGAYSVFFESVCERLVAAKPRIRFSLQLAFWDAFKQMRESRATERLARLLSGLVSRQVLSLGVLKPIDFVRLNDGTLAFLRGFFDAVLMQSRQPLREDDVLVASIFARLQGAREAAEVRDGILVFWSRVEPFSSATGLLRKRLTIAKRVLGHFVNDSDQQPSGNFSD